ncbi:MAG: VOC family protein [Kofleriaceae bacterium]
MLKNRSAPHARVTPVLIVADVRAAVAWYGKAFGSIEHVKIGEGHRAQLGFPGGGEFIVAEVRPGRDVPSGLHSHQIMLKVEDLNAVRAAAQAAGATVSDANDWEYGERQCTVDDPFGHQWVLTQTLKDTHPKDWGGELINPRG